MAVIILPLVVFGTVALIVLAMSAPTESVVQTRLRIYGYSLGNRDLSTPFVGRVLVPAMDKLAGLVKYFSPVQLESSIRARLIQAGSPAGLDVNRFLAIKAIATMVLVGISLLPLLLGGQVQVRTLVIAGALGILGWKVPDLWLSLQVDKRRTAITRALPDALDLIVVCVEAGNALEAALANVARKLRGPLAEELERTLQEIS